MECERCHGEIPHVECPHCFACNDIPCDREAIDNALKLLLQKYTKLTGGYWCESERLYGKAQDAIKAGRGMGISPKLLLAITEAVLSIRPAREVKEG